MNASSTVPHILVFYGSKRIGASAPKVATWLKEKLGSETRATFSFVDLAALNLPLYDLEWPLAPEGPFPTPAHEQWAQEAAKADGYIVITNEYNHAAAPVVKNGIDLLRAQWVGKPVGIMSYGSAAGGARAAEQLRAVFAELAATTIREQLLVPHVYSQFSDEGKLKDESVSGHLDKFMDQLLWWTHALRAAREQSPMPR